MRCFLLDRRGCRLHDAAASLSAIGGGILSAVAGRASTKGCKTLVVIEWRTSQAANKIAPRGCKMTAAGKERISRRSAVPAPRKNMVTNATTAKRKWRRLK